MSIDLYPLNEEIDPKPNKCSFCDAEAIGLSMRYTNTTDKEIPIQDCEKVFTYYCKEHQPKEGIST